MREEEGPSPTPWFVVWKGQWGSEQAGKKQVRGQVLGVHRRPGLRRKVRGGCLPEKLEPGKA